MAIWIIEELDRNSTNSERVVEEIVRTGKKIFPEYEFMNWSFDAELRKGNSGLLYSEVDGDVAGYVLYSWPSSVSGFITELAVKENFRRQGLGEALLRAAIKNCRTRNIHEISLHVVPERTAAVNLYKKLGFKVDTLIENFHSRDQNAYKMYLEIDKY